MWIVVIIDEDLFVLCVNLHLAGLQGQRHTGIWSVSQWQHLLLECPAVTVGFITGLSLLRVWTNKPRNYNCLPAKSLIGGNNDISALLIFLACRLASAYWGTSHTYVWWDEFNLSVRNDNRGYFNVMDDICQGSVLVSLSSTYPIWDMLSRYQNTWTFAKADTDSESFLISSFQKETKQVATAVQFLNLNGYYIECSSE